MPAQRTHRKARAYFHGNRRFEHVFTFKEAQDAREQRFQETHETLHAVAQKYAESIVETVREPLLLKDDSKLLIFLAYWQAICN
jgi:hypothetical protein